ncbi:MAG: AraC family transcriptional regulator [Dokdonella sp.]
MALGPLLEEFGVDLASILAESGLPAGLFDHPDNLIPYRDSSRLLDLCAARTGCAHLGLLIGNATSMDALGIVAELTRFSADVRSALLMLCRFLTLSDGGGQLALSETPRHASFSYMIYEPGIDDIRIVTDIVLAESCNALRELCGDTWSPTEVRFSYRPPVDLQPYVDTFNAPLRFDVEQSAVVFDRHWLDQALASTNAVKLKTIVAQARALEARETGDLVAQVRRILRRRLLLGNVSMQRVASELGMHRRSLDRKLQAHDATFKGLSDEVRHEVARHLLINTDMPIQSIAHSLQYADSSAFNIAFRRWSGTTPTRWRHSNRVSPAGH